MSDAVHHPSHYTSAVGVAWHSDPGVECIQITRHMTFTLGNCVKYIWRAGSKGEAGHASALEDLRKAQQYIAFEIQRLEARQPPSH